MPRWTAQHVLVSTARSRSMMFCVPTGKFGDVGERSGRQSLCVHPPPRATRSTGVVGIRGAGRAGEHTRRKALGLGRSAAGAALGNNPSVGA